MEGVNVLTVNQLVEEYPAFPEATVRWWIFNADRNGFANCLLRIGGRVYVDRKAFGAWLDQHRIESCVAEPV